MITEKSATESKIDGMENKSNHNDNDDFKKTSRPRGYKSFFMLSSVEHEILNALTYKNIKKFGFFIGSDKSRVLFFPLINVKMPTVVGILTSMSRKNFMLR